MFKSIVLAAILAAFAVNPVFAGQSGGEGGSCHGGSPSPSPSAGPSASPAAGASSSSSSPGGAGQHTWVDWLPGDPIKAGISTLKTGDGKSNVLNGCGAKNKNCIW